MTVRILLGCLFLLNCLVGLVLTLRWCPRRLAEIWKEKPADGIRKTIWTSRAFSLGFVGLCGVVYIPLAVPLSFFGRLREVLVKGKCSERLAEDITGMLIALTVFLIGDYWRGRHLFQSWLELPFYWLAMLGMCYLWRDSVLSKLLGWKRGEGFGGHKRKEGV